MKRTIAALALAAGVIFGAVPAASVTTNAGSTWLRTVHTNGNSWGPRGVVLGSGIALPRGVVLGGK